MEGPVYYQELMNRVESSELGKEWINEPLMNQDVWPVEKIGYIKEEGKLNGIKNIHFEGFSLQWLKLLTKLTVKASAREKHSLGTIFHRASCLKQLDKFLSSKGYNQPETLTDSLLRQFVNKSSSHNRQAIIIYVVNLWAEENWLKIAYTPRKYQKPTPKIETIPEEVLAQLYKNFDLFPPPLERLFRLQLALGSRIDEILRMPRQCLKKEGDEWFLQRWIAKRKIWHFKQIHPLVADLVRQQQLFLDSQFCQNIEFHYLFCKISSAAKDGTLPGERFQKEPVYMPELPTKSTINNWLKDFSKIADLKDKYGNRFNLTSHQFRRTKLSIMAYCETEDEYIAAVAGHSSLDMLPHYRKRSLERLEKEAQTKGYVDMYGRVTTFKPKQIRYEKLANILKVSTPLGECHRPTMLGDCNYRYACLNCDHHRITLEDREQLENDCQHLKRELEQSQQAGQDRRVTEITRLLQLLQTRLQGLEKLQNFRGSKTNGQ
jgi:integrase